MTDHPRTTEFTLHREEPVCATRTWTETSEAIRARSVLTERARVQACRRVGQDATDVAAVAAELGVGWPTVMRAVVEYGTGGPGRRGTRPAGAHARCR